MSYFNKPVHDVLEVIRLGGENCRAIMTIETTNLLTEAACEIIRKDSTLTIDDADIQCLNDLIEISNILYNESDIDLLPIDDGIYDMLMIIVKRYNPNYQIGARPTSFITATNQSAVHRINPFIVVDDTNKPNTLFANDIDVDWGFRRPEVIKDAKTTKKKVRNTSHNYPELVGTLDKCKFVLTTDAINRGLANSTNIEILQRDFFERHIQRGIYNPNTILTMVCELKYDGISIEADVTDHIIAARSRGDTNNDIATDFTGALSGYEFPYSNQLGVPEQFGMKFEAILTNSDLNELSYYTGKEYKNPRNAIAGLLAGKDAAKWRNFVTLVPLAASISNAMGMNRVQEIEFLNRYYFNPGDRLVYQVIQGNYIECLKQIRDFLVTADYARPNMPFAYDGIVVSYMNPDIINALGRVNSVNKYQMAVKFEPAKKDTIFLGYDYTVGQNGVITPIIYFRPIEFFGCIHSKITGHSLNRFKTLQLRVGDIITIEYVNDVMPYVVGKAECEANLHNPNPIVEFPITCPSCGSMITVTDSSAVCPNLNCPSRAIARAANMLAKINFKGFSDAAVRKLNIRSFRDLMSIPEAYVSEVLGTKTAINFQEQRNKIINDGFYDYQLVGALGFSDIAEKTWKSILTKMSIRDILSMNKINLISKLSIIPGIGEATINTILGELDVFAPDMELIASLPSTRISYGMDNKLSIRFTGCRDKNLMMQLASMGYDCTEGSVTKNTDVLIVPYLGYTSTKTKNAANAVVVALQQIQQDPIGVLNQIMMTPRK